MKTLQKTFLFLLIAVLLAHTHHARAQVVTTLAGSTAGFADGTGAAAQFNNPNGVFSDGAGNLFVADFSNNRIRRIVIATGVATTLAGQATAGSADGTGAAAQFNRPTSVCSDGAGNLFVADFSNHRIRRIVIATGVVTTLAGSTSGFADGTGAAAQFNFPGGVCSDGAGNLFVTDRDNNRIRRIVIATGVVTTLAGQATAGSADGTGAAAQFNFPTGVCSDGAGNLFVADYNNHRIRRIVIATGVVTTLAGQATAGSADGTGAAAQFNNPASVCSDGPGNLSVADASNNRIRRIVIATGVVTTLAGSTSGFADGAGAAAQFNFPIGVCSDGAGNLFVADISNHRIRRIGSAVAPTMFTAAAPPTGTVSTAYTYTFVANGSPTPTYALQSGTLPAGLMLNAATGVLSGTPTAGGSFGPFVIRATNGSGFFDTPGITVTINAAPTLFSAATPPSGTVGAGYSYTFVANGTPAPTYTLFSGTLPTGLTLSGAGVLSGTPTVAGTFGPFVVRATNGGGNLNTAGISITINPAVVPPPPPPPPVLTTPSISGGTFSGSVGLPFGANLNAGGNPAPSVSVSAGALPPGVTLTSSGLAGIPTQQGTYTFTVTASNSEGSASASITVNVGAAVPLITSVSPQSGTFGSSVTISGYNLAGANAVSIGGVAVQSFTMIGGDIVAVLGAGGTGSVNVSTPLGSTSGGSFTFEVPEPPVLTNLVLPTLTTGDENVSVFIAGRNIPVYATVTVTPIASNGRVLGESIPVQIVATSSTGATVLVPVFARLSGTKQLSVRVADRTVLATFAIVQTAPPLARELTVSSTTASGEAFTTLVNGSGFFRNGFARVFVNDDESFFSNVVSASQVRVHIPATLNVRNGSVNIRIRNLDGQQTEATVRVIGRNAPLITSVTPRWVNGNLSFIVRGVAFSPRITAVLGRRQVAVLPGGTDIEFEVAIPSDYPVPSFGTALLLVENPDRQRYGFLIGASLFERPSAFLASDKNTSELASSANTRSQARTSSGALFGQMSISPNPASETILLETPAFTGVGRLSILNARGEEILSGVVTGGERTQVDIRSLVSGAYFVRITGDGVQAVARVTVLR